jgi:hypothetical protein
MPNLLFPKRLKRDVLQASYLGLEESEIDEGSAAEVFTLRFRGLVSRHTEDGHASTVRPSHGDVFHLAPAKKREGYEKQVLCLDHRSSSRLVHADGAVDACPVTSRRRRPPLLGKPSRVSHERAQGPASSERRDRLWWRPITG